MAKINGKEKKGMADAEDAGESQVQSTLEMVMKAIGQQKRVLVEELEVLEVILGVIERRGAVKPIGKKKPKRDPGDEENSQFTSDCEEPQKTDRREKRLIVQPFHRRGHAKTEGDEKATGKTAEEKATEE